MTERRVALIGAGELGVTVCHHLRQTPGKCPVGFFDDTRLGGAVLGLPVLGGLEDIGRRWLAGDFDSVLITIGYKHLAFREALFGRLQDDGVVLEVQVHPSCIVAGTARVDEGAILFPGCVLDEGSHIRANTLLNAGCVVAHDSKIGPHTFLGPGVTLAGFIDVGARCFVGVGTVIIDNVSLGDQTQTGGGAVVVASYAGGGLIVGVPAREIRKTSTGEPREG